MPRLEDGDFATSASRFKKRRAWISPDESLSIEQPTQKQVSDLIDENNTIETKAELDYNKSATRLEQDYNKTITRVKHEIPRTEAIKNKSETKVKHEYNKSVTRLKLDDYKIITKNSPNDFYAFIKSQQESVTDYEDEPRSIILCLSDVQRQIFWCIAHECIKRKSTRTGPIEIKSFFNILAISTPVVRTTLNRLVDKRIIQREKGKLGKNGFAIISLPKIMFDAACNIYADYENR